MFHQYKDIKMEFHGEFNWAILECDTGIDWFRYTVKEGDIALRDFYLAYIAGGEL